MSEPIIFQSLTGGTSLDGNAVSIASDMFSFVSDEQNVASSEMVFESAASSSELGPAALGNVYSEAPAFVGFAADEENAASSVMAFDTYARSFDITPDIGVAVSTMSFYSITETFSADFDDAVSTMRFRSMASDQENVAMSYADDFFSTANDIPPPDSTGTSLLLFQTTGWMVLTAGYPTESVYDVALVEDFAAVSLTIHARDRAAASALLGSHLTGTSTVMDAVVAGDASAAILMLIAESQAEGVDDAAAFLNMLLSASDIALASGLATSQLTAFTLVAALAEANDVAALVALVDASDLGEVFDAAAIERIGLMVHALDAAVASDLGTASLRLIVLGADEAEGSDSLTSSLEALVHALDSGNVVGLASIDGEQYAVYGMTLAGSIMYEYTGVDCDSLFTVNNRLYGSSADGTFLLEGDTDDGADINARVRVGLSSLGTSLKKEVPVAYVGLTTDGTMLFKATSTDKGVRRTTVKALNPVRRDVVTDGRFTLAKGNHSVYWDFEVANLDGCDFELETVKVWPLPLNRRK